MQIKAKDIVIVAMMIAIIEACKAALSFLPNIELTTFWVIMFSKYLGKKTYVAIPAFILVEGAIYGMGLWWIMYLYIWPFLVVLARIFQKKDDKWFWSFLSSIFGLCFGAMCSIPYFFIGLSSGTVKSALATQISWWVAGIPWDVVHAVGNYVLMFILYQPVSRVMKRFLVEDAYLGDV